MGERTRWVLVSAKHSQMSFIIPFGEGIDPEQRRGGRGRERGSVGDPDHYHEFWSLRIITLHVHSRGRQGRRLEFLIGTRRTKATRTVVEEEEVVGLGCGTGTALIPSDTVHFDCLRTHQPTRDERQTAPTNHLISISRPLSHSGNSSAILHRPSSIYP